MRRIAILRLLQVELNPSTILDTICIGMRLTIIRCPPTTKICNSCTSSQPGATFGYLGSSSARATVYNQTCQTQSFHFFLQISSCIVLGPVFLMLSLQCQHAILSSIVFGTIRIISCQQLVGKLSDCGQWEHSLS